MKRRHLIAMALPLLLVGAIPVATTACIDYATGLGSSSSCSGTCYECGCPSGQTCGQSYGDPVPVCRTSHPRP